MLAGVKPTQRQSRLSELRELAIQHMETIRIELNLQGTPATEWRPKAAKAMETQRQKMKDVKGTRVIGVSGFIKYIEKMYKNNGVGFDYYTYSADG